MKTLQLPNTRVTITDWKIIHDTRKVELQQ